MRILLVSTYELGHQPLQVASPAAALLVAGHDVRALDLAVEPYDPERVAWAEAVAISVPMHTAMRLGVGLARRVRAERPGLGIAMYGLYAAMGSDPIVGEVVDLLVVGEYERELVAWADGGGGGVRLDLSRQTFALPARHLLPPLDRYAHLRVGDEHRVVGYTEASHGCRHRCAHCPIPAVYDGLYRVVGQEPVLADIDQLVAMGARHVTLGDPDFLNGPAYSLRVLEAAHTTHPDLTFDVTIKVEHLLQHRALLPSLAAAGVIFVVSAFETTDDVSLALLRKRHTVADMAEAVALTRRAGIEIHPSWMPFMPWTRPADVVDIFRFLDRHDLFGVTDPVQLSIRLLVPEGSLILDVPEAAAAMGEYDPEGLTHRWAATDPQADLLQAELAARAAAGADRGTEPVDTLVEMWAAALVAAGSDPGEAQIPAGATAGRPRLTEPWFC
jgi:radical SAM superfamily enzyme YgiQ (UPF0313 family)